MKWPKILTESDNVTPCPVRIGTTIATALYHLGVLVGMDLGTIGITMTTMGLYVNQVMTLLGVGGTVVGVKSVLKADAKGDE